MNKHLIFCVFYISIAYAFFLKKEKYRLKLKVQNFGLLFYLTEFKNSRQI